MVFSKLIGAVNNTKTMRRRVRRFNRRYPRAANAMQLAGKVFRLQKQVRFMKGMINSERHYSFLSFASAISSSGDVTLLSNIAQGDDVNNRNGNSILHKYLKVQWSCVMSSSATATFFRYLVVCDTANQGSTPAITDILNSASTDSQKNIDNTHRFIILKDRKFVLNINGDRGLNGIDYIKTNFHVRYSGSTGTSVLQNAIYLVSISGEATNTPTFTYATTNAFYDN